LTSPLSRRAALGLLSTGLVAALGGEARAFGDAGAFHPRILSVGGKRLGAPRESAPGRWSWELVRRTSAPARLVTAEVAIDRQKLFSEPFALWVGDEDVGSLGPSERRTLERFLRQGGMLVIDDSDPSRGAFGRSVRRELERVLPESPPVRLDSSHVVFKSYYIIDRPVGRVLGPPHIDAIVRGKNAQVLFLEHDLLGALARAGEGWALPVEPGDTRQREYAIRFAVNIAMYLLCSDYKDDQVHAPWLMRRRARSRP
jgi:hypothetical protein